MSYILDALRKSEQQRQAIQPDTVTDRILVDPTQAKQKPTKWIIALVIVNLLVIAYLAWIFTQKSAVEPQLNPQVASVTEQKPSPTLPGQREIQPAASPQNQTNQTTAPSAIAQTKPEPESPSPTLAQLVEAQKKAANQQANPKPVTEKKTDKKPIAVKKEPMTRTIENPPIQQETPDIVEERPITPTLSKGTPDLNELTYEVRNNLPNLNINVFSYDHRPEDRFVIIDMVKYKTGQLIKGSVKLKEIRADSIVLEYGGNTFKVERP